MADGKPVQPPGLEDGNDNVDPAALAALMGVTPRGDEVPVGAPVVESKAPEPVASSSVPEPSAGAEPSKEPAKARSNLLDEKKAKVLAEWVDGDCKDALLAAEAWSDLQLSKELLDGIQAKGFVRPSKIQAAALPIICAPKSRNMIGQAQNGSGKTATFSLGMLSNIDKDLKQPQAIVLCPTRELAVQTKEVVEELGKFMGVTGILLCGGGERIQKNSTTDQVAIGTPGKMDDLVKKRILNVDKVKCFILDEADVMLNQDNQMGRQVSNVRKLLKRDVQVLFFSATWPDDVREFSKKIVPNAAKITVENVNLAVDAIYQMYMDCASPQDKYQKLTELYGLMNVGQSIIFVNSRKQCMELAGKMRADGHAVGMICGTQTTGAERIDPAARDKIMQQFRQGVTKVLIATDVLARGIDVPAVTLVINYELPVQWEQGVRYDQRAVDGETYLHRVGRTGRFGMKGCAISMLTGTETQKFFQIRDRYGITANQIDDDFEILEETLKKLR